MKTLRHLAAIFRRTDFELEEAWGGALLLLYGLWLANPFASAWRVYGDSGDAMGAYTLASHVWPSEIAQGMTFAALGVLHLVAVVRAWHPLRRAFTAAVASLCWAIVTLSFIHWQWQSTATPVYGISAVGQAWLAWRHVRQAVLDEAARIRDSQIDG